MAVGGIFREGVRLAKPWPGNIFGKWIVLAWNKARI